VWLEHTACTHGAIGSRSELGLSQTKDQHLTTCHCADVIVF